MHAVAGFFGVALILVMLFEFFVAFLLPRRVRRDPRIARGLGRLVWLPWCALARRLPTAAGDTWLGFFGPFGLLFQLTVWTLGLMLGYGLLEWGAVGGSFGKRLLSSSGVFLSAESPSGSTSGHLIGLFEAATGVAVVFIVIGYLPAVYAAFSRREIAVSQLAARAGSPPAAGVLLHQAISHLRDRTACARRSRASVPAPTGHRSGAADPGRLRQALRDRGVADRRRGRPRNRPSAAQSVSRRIRAERRSPQPLPRARPPRWLPEDTPDSVGKPGVRVGGDGRDLVG